MVAQPLSHTHTRTQESCLWLRYVRSEQEPLWNCANSPDALTGVRLPFRYGWSQSAVVSLQAARVTSAHVCVLTEHLNNKGSVSRSGRHRQGRGRQVTAASCTSLQKEQKAISVLVEAGEIRRQCFIVSIAISAVV